LDLSNRLLHSSCYTVLVRKQWCTKPRFALKNPTLQPCSMFIWLYSIFLLFLFIYLFIYFDTPWECQMYSQCAPYLRHRFRKENKNTGGLCYAIIPVLGSGENESQRCLTISRKEPNDNLLGGKVQSHLLCKCSNETKLQW